MIERDASDLHITAGERPKLRIDGDIVELQERLRAHAQGHAAARLLRAHGAAEEAVRDGRRARLLVRHPGPRALPRQLLQAARLRVDGDAADPDQHQDLQRPRPAAGHRAHGGEAARAGARHRADGLGQVDHARGDDRQDQPGAQGAHHHGRGSDRVHPPASGLHHQPARGRDGHQELRERAEVRAARGSRRRCSSAKCATSRRSRPR